jgi:myxalamid-type polyketide synthase MxaE and MxaD
MAAFQRGGDDQALVDALSTIRALKGRIEAIERSRHEDLAIVGIGCRLPGGARSPAELWTLLADGRDAITEVPPSRWPVDALHDPDPAAAGKMTLRHGGFVDGVEAFDAAFFGISPREAARIDPQQRMFLEVAWEAIEDAGIAADTLRGSDASVFVGANATDYLQLQLADANDIDLYTTVGSANCIIANRLSYFLDLRGASLTIDTACSSSLVALHLACRELRARDSDVAIVGGVNVVVSPSVAIGHSKGLPVSPDGRCKTFDASADGYSRAEGVVAVVLKRLSDAQAARDRIWAVVRGSAVNQDGLTNGLTAPNGVSQRRVIRRALADARLQPERVALVECHGTGTVLGDPIEVEALDAIYGAASAEAGACAIGSVKTNIGHLEAGAGLAGLVKAALCVHHATIAPTVNFRQLNPELEIGDGRLLVATEAMPWPHAEGERCAAVSSFGAGGTNAHVVLASAPPEPEPAAAAADHGAPSLVLISAATADAVAPMAAAYRDLLAGAEALEPVARATAARRTHHEHRCAVVAATPAEAAARLDDWLRADAPTQVLTGRASAPLGHKVAFVCPGQGAQHPGMGWDLLEHCPAFAESMQECDEAMRPWLGHSIIEAIPSIGPDSGVAIVQPALFAISVSLAARLRSLGVTPDLVVGHSMGEVSAAHIAGVLSLADAVRITCRRSAMLARVAGRGAMLLVARGAAELAPLLEAHAELVSLAASNGPLSTVLSGDAGALEQIEAALAAVNVFARRVKVDVASHSPQVDPLLDDLLAELQDVAPRRGTVPIVSTVTGELCDGAQFDAAYWVRNLRQPVRFSEATRLLLEHDAGAFVELGPHPVLSSAVEQTVEHAGREALALPMMRRDQPSLETSAEVFAALWASGHPAAPPQRLDEPVAAVALPGYRWQHRPLWFRAPGAAVPLASAAGRPAEPAPVLAEADAPAGEPLAQADLVDVITDAVAETLALQAAEVDPRMGFFQMGMDSMLAGRVRARIEARIARRLPARVMFEQPTVESLAAHLAPASNGTGRAPDVPEPASNHPGSADDELSEDDLLAAITRELSLSTDDQGGRR